MAFQYNNTIHRQLGDTICGSLDQICCRRSPPTDECLRDFWIVETTAAFNLRGKEWRKAHGFNALRLCVSHQEAQAKLRQLVIFVIQWPPARILKQSLNSVYSKKWNFQTVFLSCEWTPTCCWWNGLTPSTYFCWWFTTSCHRLTVDSRHWGNNCYNCVFFTIETVNEAIVHLPRYKAPGVDYLTIETLLPITEHLAPTILVYLFQFCWRWSYTLLSWWVAQVLPILENGPLNWSWNLYPINSSTSILRKILNKCRYRELVDQSPTLDIAQGGFREARSTLDQALPLVEICSILRKHNQTGIPWYQICNRYCWSKLYLTSFGTMHWFCTTQLVYKHLFSEVQIEVLLGSATSDGFSPSTGTLIDSILSLFLYSIYINQLPNLLSTHHSWYRLSTWSSWLCTAN